MVPRQSVLKDTFAVILLDVSMPEMDGFETARRIRAHPRFERTPIVFVTGVHITELDKLRGYEVRAIDYIPVPLVPEILRSKVTLLVELYTRRAELQRLNRELTDAHERLSHISDVGPSSTAKFPGAQSWLAADSICFLVAATRGESGEIAYWRFLDANRAVFAFLKHSRADLIGMRLEDVPADADDSLAVLCTRVSVRREPFTYQSQSEQGKIVGGRIRTTRGASTIP